MNINNNKIKFIYSQEKETEKRKQEGITLIALVITIIVLLILSGITIQSITHTGIFDNAKQAELQNKRAQIIEYLKLKLMNEQTNNPFGTAEEIITATRNNVIENIEDLKKIGKEVTVEETSTEEDGENVDIYFYVIVDKDVYKVELDDVTFIGELGKFPPVIKLKSISNTTNTITVEVTTKRNQGGILEYYIKSEDEEEYKLIKTITEEKYTYEGLTQNKKYSIKVIAVAENKKTAEVIAEQTIVKIVDLTEANAKFTYSSTNWTNENVTATASTDVAGYIIQTSLDGKNWSETTSQTLTVNGPVYARLWDGTNAGGMLTGNVKNIDKTKPIVTEATATTNSIKIAATDEASGIIGYAVTTSTTIPTSFTSISNIKTLNITVSEKTQGTTYYIWVKDAAGNISTSKSTSTKNVTGLTTANAKFTYSPSGWTNGSVTATASTDVTGFTIQTSTDGNNWTSTASKTLTANGPVYARLWDGKNAGGMLTGNVTKIDKAAPTIGQISNGFTIVSGNTGTINITGIADTGSGISGYHVNTTGTRPTTSSTWTSSTASSISYNVRSAGTYYFWIKDKVGNISEAKSCKISIATAVAQVGTIYYSSISNAINAISTNGTIILLRDTTEDITIPSNKTITLNLNQKTLKGTGALRIDGKYDSPILNNGTLTIYGGSTIGNDWAVYNTNKLIINSGTYTATQFEAIFHGTGTTEINAGTFTGGNFGLCNYGGVTTVRGGTFNGVDGIRNSNGTLNIINGIFNGEYYGALNFGGTTNISGGTFNGNIGGMSLENGNATISGGNFTGEKGIYTGNGTMTITGGTMRGNTYDGLSNYGATVYINGGNFSGKNWGIYSKNPGKIFYRRTDSQYSDQGWISPEGWQAVSASDLTFY